MMQVRQEVSTITAADFSFTCDEVALLFRDVLGKDITLDDSQRLADLTEGWAGALVLMADKVQTHGPAALEQLRAPTRCSSTSPRAVRSAAGRTEELPPRQRRAALARRPYRQRAARHRRRRGQADAAGADEPRGPAGRSGAAVSLPPPDARVPRQPLALRRRQPLPRAEHEGRRDLRTSAAVGLRCLPLHPGERLGQHRAGHGPHGLPHVRRRAVGHSRRVAGRDPGGGAGPPAQADVVEGARPPLPQADRQRARPAGAGRAGGGGKAGVDHARGDADRARHVPARKGRLRRIQRGPDARPASCSKSTARRRRWSRRRAESWA